MGWKEKEKEKKWEKGGRMDGERRKSGMTFYKGSIKRVVEQMLMGNG